MRVNILYIIGISLCNWLMIIANIKKNYKYDRIFFLVCNIVLNNLAFTLKITGRLSFSAIFVDIYIVYQYNPMKNFYIRYRRELFLLLLRLLYLFLIIFKLYCIIHTKKKSFIKSKFLTIINYIVIIYSINRHTYHWRL